MALSSVLWQVHPSIVGSVEIALLRLARDQQLAQRYELVRERALVN
jgi:hypothetical protein